MAKKITVAVIGCGDFACNFVPLFQAHPYVEKVYVCDIIPERAREYSQRFGVEIIDTFENAIADSKITAVAIFTQRHLHGPLVKAALEAGKDVYSAVPMGVSVEECREIVETVKKTGKTYMMGETCIYYPCSMYCKQRYEKGDFGTFVYAEAQYHHDISHFPKNFREDLVNAGVPPFYYPTHSTSMVLSAANAYAVKVAAFGYEDKLDPEIFGKGKNYWDNPFSNTAMLMKLSNGAVARISENRRVAWNTPPTYISHFYATKASYECSLMQHSYITMPDKEVFYEDVSDLINPIELTKHKHEPDFLQKAIRGEWASGEAPIQIIHRLPEELVPLETNHAGTHKFMVDDFCQAYMTGKLSPTNAWQAARYNLPGLTAHQSAMQGGVTLDVPDCGNPPAELEVLGADRKENPYDYR